MSRAIAVAIKMLFFGFRFQATGLIAFWLSNSRHEI